MGRVYQFLLELGVDAHRVPLMARRERHRASGIRRRHPRQHTAERHPAIERGLERGPRRVEVRPRARDLGCRIGLDPPVPRHDDGGMQRLEPVERPQRPRRRAIDHHAHPILDNDVPGEEHADVGNPGDASRREIRGRLARSRLRRDQDSEIPRRVRVGRMQDLDAATAERERGVVRDRQTRRVGEREPHQLLDTDDAIPVGDQRIVAFLGGEEMSIGMRDHLSAHPLEHDRAERMVGMVVRENQPPHGRRRLTPDAGEQALGLIGTGLGVDDHHAAVRDDEARVGPSLGAASRVAGHRVHPFGQSDAGIRRWSG